jgi:4-hydroxymandelate oxidase
VPKLEDWDDRAREVLCATARGRMAWNYYRSGARDEATLRANRAAFARCDLVPRVLTAVGEPDPATTVLGDRIGFPVVVAPMAFQALVHPDGEAATRRGATAAGTAMALSTLSTTAVEGVVAAGGSGPGTWFQLYVYRDRGITAELVARAEAAGCRALLWTVDAPVLGTREADEAGGFHLPPDLALRNVAAPGTTLVPAGVGSGLSAYVRAMLDPALGWADLDWLAGRTRLPILLKGVLHPHDAVEGVKRGAAGVVVSNHGGRQLDHAIPSLDALPPIAEALAALPGDPTVLMDGGIRRGTDVLKARLAGAQAVLLGRPVLWGLAVDGAEGVAAILGQLRAEIVEAMALYGWRSWPQRTSNVTF